MDKPNQIAAQRLFLNADKTKLVGAESKDAAFLYAAEGDEIPGEACERFGIVDGKLKGKAAKPALTPTPTPAPAPAATPKEKAPAKAKAPAKKKAPAKAPANKEQAPAENKGDAQQGGDA